MPWKRRSRALQLGAHRERTRRLGDPVRPGGRAGGAHRQGSGGSAAGVGSRRWGEHRPSPVAIYSADEELPLAVDMVLYPHPGEDAPALAVERLDVQEEGERVPACQTPPRCSVSGPGEALRDCLLSPQQALRSTSE